MEYQCSTCGNEYSNEEYRKLDRVQAVKEEADPTGPTGHGYHAVCECGHEFHKDDWNKKTTIKTDEREFEVSTTHLVLNHGHGDRDLWYETGVFWDSGSYIIDRYETQKEAAYGHEQVVASLRKGNFTVQDNLIASLSIGDKE